MLGGQGIVVDLGSRQLTAVLYSSSLGRTKVERKALASSVEELLSELPADAPITLMLPGHLFLARRVTLPFTNAKLIRRTLPFELEGLVPLPIDELLIDSVPSSPATKGSCVMALAIPRQTIADCLQRFPDGRRPERVIPDFVSLLALALHTTSDHGTYGMLNVAAESTSIVLIAGGRPLMMRSIKTDGDASLVEWVDATINAFGSEGHHLEALYLTGMAAREAAGALGRVTQVVPLAEPLAGVGSREWPAWSILAGGAISVSEFPRFNILGAPSGGGTLARTFATVSLWAGILLALGTADLYVRYATASQALSAGKAESKQVFLSAMPHVKNVVNEDAQLRIALVKARQTRAALTAGSPTSYRAISRGLATLVTRHPEISVRETAIEGDRLTLAGEGRGIPADALKRLVSAIDGAQSAQVEEIVQGVEPNSARFRVKVRLRP